MKRKYDAYVKQGMRAVKSAKYAYDVYKKNIRPAIKKWKAGRTKTRKMNSGNKNYDKVTRSSGITKSQVKIKYRSQKKNKFIKTIGEPALFKTNGTGTLDSESNSQNNSVICATWFGGNDVINTGNVSQNLGTMANVAAFAAGGGNEDFKKYLIDFADFECVLSNTSQFGLQLDIYTCVAKATFNTTVFGGDIWLPTQVWNQSVTAEPDTTDFIGNPGNDPRKYKTFNQKWKVVKKHSIDISTGGTHKHYFRHDVNRLVDRNHFDDSKVVRGITMCTFIVIKGTQLMAESVAPFRTTLNSSKVRWYTTARYQLRTITQNFKFTQEYNNLPIVPLANQVGFVEDEIGEVVNDEV